MLPPPIKAMLSVEAVAWLTEVREAARNDVVAMNVFQTEVLGLRLIRSISGSMQCYLLAALQSV